MSEGSRAAAFRTGGGSESWAMHVKGLEMPGFHPGRLRHLALALAVSPRGACHNKASAYDFDLSDDAAQRADASEIGRAVAEAEDFAAVLDSLVLSKFVRRVLNDFYPEAAHVYRLATGHDIGADGLRKAGRADKPGPQGVQRSRGLEAGRRHPSTSRFRGRSGD